MSYHKLRADHLFTGQELLPSSFILIIGTDGEIISIVEQAENNDGVEIVHGILSPGFINAHCHLELSYLKGLVEPGKGMLEFISSVMELRSEVNDLPGTAIVDAENLMIANGIVAVGDICNTDNTVLQKKKQRLSYYNFIEVTGFIEQNALERFQFSKALQDQFLGMGPASIVPHAPYSVSKPLFEMIAAQPSGKTITIHNQESLAEADFFLTSKGDLYKLYEKLGLDISFFNNPGKTSIQATLPLMKYRGKLILVHNVTTSIGDIDFAKKQSRMYGTELFWCLCPNANLYIGNSLPPVLQLIRTEENIVLGTDSLASNQSLSILEEMKTIVKNFPGVDTATVLGWATINGARALQMDEQLGSFEKGKRPGVILIEDIDNGKIKASSTVRRMV